MVKRVVIGVSTYGQADYYLPRCLQSIKDQTFKNWICVVGDDHSPDNTREVVESFAKKDKRFIYHLTPRKYVLNSYFYNWLAKHYRAEYLATCDGDNRFYPDHLARLVKILDLTKSVAAYGFANNVVYKEDKRTIEKIYARGEYWEINRYIFGTSYYNFIDMADILFRRKYFLKAGGYITSDMGHQFAPTYQDYSIMVRLALMFNNKIECVPEVLSEYSVHHDSQSRTRDADLRAHMFMFTGYENERDVKMSVERFGGAV